MGNWTTPLNRIHNRITEAKQQGFLPCKIVVSPSIYSDIKKQEVYFDSSEQKLFGFRVEPNEDCDSIIVMCGEVTNVQV